MSKLLVVNKTPKHFQHIAHLSYCVLKKVQIIQTKIMASPLQLNILFLKIYTPLSLKTFGTLLVNYVIALKPFSDCNFLTAEAKRM